MQRVILSAPEVRLIARGALSVLRLPPDKPPAFDPGDLIRVCESWFTPEEYANVKPSELDADTPIRFAADALPHDTYGFWQKRPAGHLPEWASRLVFVVDGVALRRVHEVVAGTGYDLRNARRSWDVLHGKRYPWSSDPMIAAVTVRPYEAPCLP